MVTKQQWIDSFTDALTRMNSKHRGDCGIRSIRGRCDEGTITLTIRPDGRFEVTLRKDIDNTVTEYRKGK